MTGQGETRRVRGSGVMVSVQQQALPKGSEERHDARHSPVPVVQILPAQLIEFSVNWLAKLLGSVNQPPAHLTGGEGNPTKSAPAMIKGSFWASVQPGEGLGVRGCALEDTWTHLFIWAPPPGVPQTSCLHPKSFHLLGTH